MDFLQKLISYFKPQPDLKFVAKQLRKPSGEFAEKIADKMDKSNYPLYEVTLKALQLKDHEHVLEIGFGSGKFMYRLFEDANVKVSGLDYSEDMLKKAEEHNAELIETGKLDLHLGSSNQLPFDDNSFDKVFCNMVIFFWDKPEEHLQEVKRVLKPGGKFYSGFRPRDSMEQFPFVEHGFNLYAVDEWQNILEENGFTVTNTFNIADPPLEAEGKIIHLSSVCIESQKNQ